MVTPPTPRPPQRGDIYWVNIPQSHTVGSEQYKRRPWLIVSSGNISHLSVVIGVPLSSKVAKKNRTFRIAIPASQIRLETGSTLDVLERVALTEQVRCLSVERLEMPRQGVVTPTALGAVEAGVAFVLDIH